MSYGQPWRRMTAGPSAGPASAYPTFRRPASIGFREPKDVGVPGFSVDPSAELMVLAGALAESMVVSLVMSVSLGIQIDVVLCCLADVRGELSTGKRGHWLPHLDDVGGGEYGYTLCPYDPSPQLSRSVVKV